MVKVCLVEVKAVKSLKALDVSTSQHLHEFSDLRLNWPVSDPD